MPARTDYSAITAIDNMGNKPLSLFVKGTVNVLVFVYHFRMLLSRYKGKRCILWTMLRFIIEMTSSIYVTRLIR